MSVKEKKLIVIAGPTAVGKTALAIQVGLALDTEIISCDSRQFYRELEVGTAKPSAEELSAIPHHFINSLSIHDAYSAGQYEREALDKLEFLFQTHDYLVMVGGSGLYIDAVCQGFDDIPTVDLKIREELNQLYLDQGLTHLTELLKQEDKEYYNVVDKMNHQRIIRALEVIMSTGKTFTSFREKKTTKDRPFSVIKLAIHEDREKLFSRIDHRMDRMIAQGLFDEAEEFYAHKHLNALQTVGYKEIFDFMDGHYDREEAVRLLKRNSRRYAKRQLTWLRRDERYQWYERQDFDKIMSSIQSL